MQDTFTSRLDSRIRAVCPAIDGVSIGLRTDKSTWRVLFNDSVTDDQRAAAQGVIASFDPTAPEPVTAVSPRQARLALLQQGLLDQVATKVSAIGGATQITWEYATVFERTDPMIAAIGQQLGLNDAQLDQLFTLASTL